MKMQDTSHKAGDYARPNLNWYCGREDCCQLGPTTKGKCSDTERPCVPQRSVKSKKRVAAIWLFSILIGVMTVFLSTSALLTRISPGPVSMSHAEVATCERCHTAAGDDISQWFKKAAISIIGTDASDQHSSDEQCLSCHTLGENALLAHSTSPDNFSGNENTNELSSLGLTLSLSSKLRSLQMSTSDEVSCSECHQEHKGERNLRDSFDSQRCHTCHEMKFDALEVGHPEYTKFPYAKPTKIEYDHSNHKGKYFYEDEYIDRAPKVCQDCHFTDQTGEWMLVKNFEEACSSCHLDEVLGMDRTTAKGIAVFIVPEIDVKTLNRAGFNIGEWPSWAEGELTPFMRALLPNRLAKSGELKLNDLSRASEKELETAALLAWETKRLLYELVRGGTAVLYQRLSNALRQQLDQSTMNRLIAALPKDTLLNNQQEWFPNLLQELDDYRSGKIKLKGGLNLNKNTNGESLPLETPVDATAVTTAVENVNDEDSNVLNSNQVKIPTKKVEQSMPDEDWAISGGWYRDGSSLRYRPTDHADLFFKTWLELSASQSDRLEEGSLFNSLSADKSIGNCTLCHTVVPTEENDALAGGQQGKPASYKINWRSFHPSDVLVDFNRFSHVTHFNKDCVSCHELNGEPAVDIAKRGGSRASNVAPSGFVNMEKNACTQCHQKGRAPDNCLTCHNYHAEPHRNRVETIPDMPSADQ